MEVGVQRLGKRSHREITADRRHKEAEALQEIGKSLPLSKSQVERSNQSSLLRLAINFIKARELMSTAGLDSATLKRFSLDESLNFFGFIILVDLKGNVLYATEKITEQLGPYLVDVVGNPITELIHPDDVQQLRELLDVNVLSMLHSKQHMFVVRMKCNLSSYTKSSKIHYKNVFISCRLKSFKKPAYGLSAGPLSLDSSTVVLLCRTEDLIGFPEIILGSYVNFESSIPDKVFTKMDSKGQWLLGYRTEDIVGQDPFLFRHPRDRPPSQIRKFAEVLFKRNLKENGYVRFPRGRFLTAWGEWVWTQTDVKPLEMDGDNVVRIKVHTCLLEPDDGTERSLEWRISGTTFDWLRKAAKNLSISGQQDGINHCDLLFKAIMHQKQEIMMNSENPVLSTHSSSSSPCLLLCSDQNPSKSIDSSPHQNHHSDCQTQTWNGTTSSVCSGSDNFEGPSPQLSPYNDWSSESISVGSSQVSPITQTGGMEVSMSELQLSDNCCESSSSSLQSFAQSDNTSESQPSPSRVFQRTPPFNHQGSVEEVLESFLN